METTRLIRLSKVIVGMLLLIFSTYLIIIPWTYLIPISSNFWSVCIKFWWIYIGFLKEYVKRGSYWLTCQSFVFKDEISVGFGNCSKVVPQSTGHLNGPESVVPWKWTNPVRKVWLENEEDLVLKVARRKLCASKHSSQWNLCWNVPYLLWFAYKYQLTVNLIYMWEMWHELNK